MKRASDGSITLIGKHPKGCTTWHWYASLTSKKHVEWGWRLWVRASPRWRVNQWHDYYRLPFGWTLVLGFQDYHKEPSQ